MESRGTPCARRICTTATTPRQGRSTRDLPYSDRRALLQSLRLQHDHASIASSEYDGQALLGRMELLGREGIIAKRRSSRYRFGIRSPDWIKIKLTQSDEFLVVGYWSSGKHPLSSLLLGYYASRQDAAHGRPLRYAGKVGTGFSESGREALAKALQAIATDLPPCQGALPHGPGVHWCLPQVVVQVRFTEWTHDGALRHPSFVEVRSDREARDVVHRPQEAV